MKKIIIMIMIIVTFAYSQIGVNPNYQTVSTLRQLTSAIDRLDGKKGTLQIIDTVSITGRDTIPGNVDIQFIGRGRFSGTTGSGTDTLIMHSPNTSARHQIFDSSLTVKLLAREYGGDIYANWFAGNDSTGNDSAGLQRAINSISRFPLTTIYPVSAWGHERYVILNRRYNLGGKSIRISRSMISLRGESSAQIFEGKLIIGEDAGYTNYHGTIKDIEFRMSGDADSVRTDTLILLASGNFGKILNCKFYWGAVSIGTPQTLLTNRVAHWQVQNCYFYGSKKAIYWYWTGDSEIENCFFRNVTDTTIHIDSCDGVVITNNTLYPNSPTTGACQNRGINPTDIYIHRGHWVKIDYNQLFQAGGTSIIINRATDFDISHNEIAWPGEYYTGHGIEIKNGGFSGGSIMLGAVHSNRIYAPAGHGIYVHTEAGQDSCKAISIRDNFITTPGTSLLYCGSGTVDANSNGIYLDSSTSAISVDGNEVHEAGYSIYGSTGYAMHGNNNVIGTNWESIGMGEPLRENVGKIIYDTTHTLDTRGYKNFYYAGDSSTYWDTIIGGYVGKEIEIRTNKQLTIKYDTTSINLSGYGDLTLKRFESVRLYYTGSTWFEVSRSMNVSGVNAAAYTDTINYPIDDTIDVSGQILQVNVQITNPDTIRVIKGGSNGQTVYITAFSPGVTVMHDFHTLWLSSLTPKTLKLNETIVIRYYLGQWREMSGSDYDATDTLNLAKLKTTGGVGMYAVNPPAAQPASAAQAAAIVSIDSAKVKNLTISASYSQGEIQALRDSCAVLGGDVNRISTLLHAIRTVLIDMGAMKGSP